MLQATSSSKLVVPLPLLLYAGHIGPKVTQLLSYASHTLPLSLPKLVFEPRSCRQHSWIHLKHGNILCLSTMSDHGGGWIHELETKKMDHVL
ncbi:hypothetical protein SLA2020_154730 [Shorea laevis]